MALLQGFPVHFSIPRILKQGPEVWLDRMKADFLTEGKSQDTSRMLSMVSVKAGKVFCIIEQK